MTTAEERDRQTLVVVRALVRFCCRRGGHAVRARGRGPRRRSRREPARRTPSSSPCSRARLRRGTPASSGSQQWFVVGPPRAPSVADGPESPRRSVFGWLPVEVRRQVRTTRRAVLTAFPQVRLPFQVPGGRRSLENSLRIPRGFVAWSLEVGPAEFWSSRNRPAETNSAGPRTRRNPAMRFGSSHHRRQDLRLRSSSSAAPPPSPPSAPTARSPRPPPPARPSAPARSC